jgi:hypothetical protein
MSNTSSLYDDVVIDRSVVAALISHPGLWFEALRAAVGLAPRGWWLRPPFLPLPDRAHLAWRLHTAYGTDQVPMTPQDVLSYLEWRKRQRSQG